MAEARGAATGGSAGPLQSALREWYGRFGRSLAFRGRSDPWAVLVSEVMAQQTQVSRVEPAWAAFLEAFPDPAHLAMASPAAVLRAWAGLGYNRRALDLQRAAAVLVERHGGRVPGDVASLMALPGVGPYTARAVAAISFAVPVAAVDTNIGRVVGRVAAGHGQPADGAAALAPGALQAAADALVDAAHPDTWTHAMMDVGALLCRPRDPHCGACPLASWCRFATHPAGAAEIGPLGDNATARPETAVDGPRTAPRTRAATRPGRPRQPFPATSRWLRGRIVSRLRDLDDGVWLRLDEPIGDHPARRVAEALGQLEREGLLERRTDGAVRLPSGR